MTRAAIYLAILLVTACGGTDDSRDTTNTPQCDKEQCK